ncbi:preprotein translocase subunit SecG [Candidatus Saccharibacteria bacterium]|nr:preprotein translocase subunit SecG [Candidatus Saccharibacteria bacterium]
MNVGSFLQAVILVSAVLTVLLVLIQQRGASLGAGFGASGELYTARRGLDKSLFRATVVTSLVFVFSIIGLLIVPA